MPPTHSRPQRLYGRSLALSALKRWLRPKQGPKTDDLSVRLKVLWGPPGVGKTRLAKALCEDLQDKKRAPCVHFVDLTACVCDADLLDATASALALHTPEGADLAKTSAALMAHWARTPETKKLLILDNFEQMHPDAAARVLGWLEAVPALYVLVTTRIATPWPESALAPLTTLPTTAPDSSSPHPDEHPAHALFLAAALRQDPSIDPQDPATRAGLHQVVQALDGLPLALELVAARLSLMSLTEIQARLTQCLPLLDHTFADVPKSLHAALAASWSLLSGSAQQTLARCSIFRADFSLSAAEAVLPEDPLATNGDLFNDLQALLDASLLQRDPSRQRLSVSAPVRAFAALQLEKMRQSEPLKRRFCDHFAAFAVATRASLVTAQDAAPLARLSAEREHLKAVIEMVLEPPQCLPLDAALDAALGLDTLTRYDNTVSDILNIFRKTLEAAQTLPCDLHRRADLIASAWRMARIQGQRALQASLISTALSLLTDATPPPTASIIHHAAAVHLWSATDHLAALRHAQAALACAQSQPVLQARALTALAWLAADAGDHNTCIQHAERGVHLLEAHGARYEWLIAANNLAVFYKQRSALDAALELFSQIFSTARTLRCVYTELHALQALASLKLLIDAPDCLACLQACAALEQQLSIPQVRTSNRIDLAWCHIFHRHDPPQALSTLQEALAIQENHGIHRMLSFTLQSIAELQLLLGLHQEARSTLDRALSIAKNLNNIPHLALLLSLCASAYAPIDPSAARELLRQATVHARDVVDDTFQLGISLETLYTFNILGEIPPDPEHPATAPHFAHLIRTLTPTPAVLGRGAARPHWQFSRYMRATTARVLAALPPSLRRAAWTRVLNPDPQSFVLDQADPLVVRLPCGDWLDLQAKPVLGRVLSALLLQRARGSLAPLSCDACIAAGWPGERILVDAAQTRLQQVVSRLRREGLGDTIENAQGGYRIAPPFAVALVPLLTQPRCPP